VPSCFRGGVVPIPEGIPRFAERILNFAEYSHRRNWWIGLSSSFPALQHLLIQRIFTKRNQCD
jgi:hypothetical protein